MITTVRETWDGADGDPWPSPWAFVGGYDFQTVYTSPTIINNAGRLTSGTGNSQGWGYSFGQVNFPGSFGDFDIKCKMTFQYTNLKEQYLDICFGQQSGGPHTGETVMSFEMSRWDTVWQARFWDATTGTQVGNYQNFADGDNLGDVPIWIRAKREGTDLLGKAWKVGEPEPDWTCHAAGEARYANVGELSLVVTNGSDDTEQYVDLDDFTLAVPGLGYLGSQPIFKAYKGETEITKLSLG